MEIEHTLADSGVLIVNLSGRLVMGPEVQSVERTIDGFTKQGQNRIVIDMSQVYYIDSCGVGALVGCHSRLKDAGGHLRLAAPTERVEKIFNLTGVDRILLIHPTRQKAVAAFEAKVQPSQAQ